jgi:hypothetical protein
MLGTSGLVAMQTLSSQVNWFADGWGAGASDTKDALESGGQEGGPQARPQQERRLQPGASQNIPKKLGSVIQSTLQCLIPLYTDL